MLRPMLLLPAVWLALGAPALGDDFDRLEGRLLSGIPTSEAARGHESLSVSELGNLPRVLAGVRSGLVVVKTGEANYSRLLASAGYRRPPSGQAMTKPAPFDEKEERKTPEPAPILVLERLDTFEGAAGRNRLAHARDLILFDGFEYDLDSGQVVPPGQGGDIRFVARDGGRLEALGETKLFTLTKSPLTGASVPAKPSSGKAIVPTDHAGRYRLFANGQWSGILDLEVADRGVVSGRFRSDQTGQSYAVTGQVASDQPAHIQFAVQFPRSRQEYDGHLWTEGKGAMAGRVSLLDRDYGFFAIREEGRFAPADAEVDGLPLPQGPPRRVLTVRARGGLDLDGLPVEPGAIAGALRNEPGRPVVVRFPQNEPFGEASRLIEAIHSAGVTDIRLEVVP